MSKKILSVSIVEDSYHYLEVARQPKGISINPPQTASTPEALMAACRKADEIYLNASFPTAMYQWELFPKVAKRYLHSLVKRDAQEKLGASVPISVQSKQLEEIVDAGVPKWQTAYLAIPTEEITRLWESFKDFHRKIKYITSLPVALAKIITQCDHPGENFMAIWIGEHATVMLINSPSGTVKIARNVPIGLPNDTLSADQDSLNQFSQNLAKEITMTTTFFKQEFREQVPKILYLLGRFNLQDIVQKDPLFWDVFNIRFNLSRSQIQSMTTSQVSENMHLLGNLYLANEFNFLPRKETTARKTAMAFKIAYALLVFITIAGAVRGLQLTGQKSEMLTAFDNKFLQLQNLQKQVEILRDDVNRLRPFEGWKLFYENTFKNQPSWNLFISELALLMSSNIVINNLNVRPEPGPNGQLWNGIMSGTIRAKDWRDGLNLLREFGGKLQRSAFFEVTNVQYAPETMASVTKDFDFQIALKLLPKEMGYET